MAFSLDGTDIFVERSRWTNIPAASSFLKENSYRSLNLLYWLASFMNPIKATIFGVINVIGSLTRYSRDPSQPSRTHATSHRTTSKSTIHLYLLETSSGYWVGCILVISVCIGSYIAEFCTISMQATKNEHISPCFTDLWRPSILRCTELRRPEIS